MMQDAALGQFIWAPAWPAAWAVLAFLTAQRLLELVYAQKNTRALLARGAMEYGREHYPLMVAIHAGFLAALWFSTAPDAPMLWPLLSERRPALSALIGAVVCVSLIPFTPVGVPILCAALGILVGVPTPAGPAVRP